MLGLYKSAQCLEPMPLASAKQLLQQAPPVLWERLKGPFWEELPYRNFTETRTSPCMKRTLMRRSLTLQGPLADPLCWETVPLRQELLTASASFQERHHYQKRHQELVDSVSGKTPSFTRRAGKGRRPQIAPGPDSRAPPPHSYGLL